MRTVIAKRIMVQTLGAIDRAVRIVLGLALIALVGIGPKTMEGLLGLYPLVTARLGWCPLYRLLGISSDRGDVEAPRRTLVINGPTTSASRSPGSTRREQSLR
jgi:hypothetical protein